MTNSTRNPAKRAVLIAATVLLVLSAASGAADDELPDIGSPADAALSKSDEDRYGRSIMAQLRATGNVVDDPEITEYINNIGHRLAAQVNDNERAFNFFVVKDSRINAFALPGGFIGVHTGLIEATRNEDELAGVLAHEVAHVTQRHIARAIHANQRQSLTTMAIMLGAILAGVAGGGGDVLQGGIAVAQGTAAQQQINFTRTNENEADRVGINTLAGAGFDPYGMASFFEVMAKQRGPVSAEIPEFLLTHPVNNKRIAESRRRARKLATVDSEDSTGYGLTKARIIVQRHDTREAAIRHLTALTGEDNSAVNRYGLALAYQRAGRHADANSIFKELITQDDDVIAYHIGLAESQMALEQRDAALASFQNARELFPRNVPVVIHYAEALLAISKAEQAHEMLLDLLNNVPPTPEQVRLIARAAVDAGETAEAHYYLAEYNIMIGDLVQAVNLLAQALRLKNLQPIQRSRFESRIDFLKEYMSEEQLRRLPREQRSLS